MSRYIIIVLVALVLGLVMSACRSQSADPTDPGPKPRPELNDPMKTLLNGTHTGIQEEGLLICRNQDAWQALWRRHTRLQLPGPPLPEVDFTTHCVLGVFCGWHPTAGYSVQILGFDKTDSGHTLRASLHSPDPSMAQAQVETTPFELLVVPRFKGMVNLQFE